METVFSVGSTLSLYNEDPRPTERIEGASLRWKSKIIEESWQERN
jgi:hypothetical protein